MRRLLDPKDDQAAWRFAGVLLLLEAALCAIIIVKVPCKRTTVAMM